MDGGVAQGFRHLLRPSPGGGTAVPGPMGHSSRVTAARPTQPHTLSVVIVLKCHRGGKGGGERRGGEAAAPRPIPNALRASQRPGGVLITSPKSPDPA